VAPTEENRTTEKLREEEAEEAAEGLKSADLKVALWLHVVLGDAALATRDT
jgi:hypothetical protein